MNILWHILNEQLTGWVEAGIEDRLIIARPHMEPAYLPEGVRLTPHKIKGKRIIVKGRRNYGNIRNVRAEWPDDGLHEGEFARFICVVEGQVNFRAGNYMLGCNRGDFLLIPPGTPHPAKKQSQETAASATKNQHCILLWMTLYQRGVQCWLSRYDDTGKRFDRATENYLLLNDQVTQLFKLFIEEVQGEKCQRLYNSILLAFVTSLQREAKAQHYLHPGPHIEDEAKALPNADFNQQLIQYIQKNLNKPLRLEEAAREMYLSPTQFMRRMRQETGQTFIEFLNHYRIKEAKVLLRDSEWTVQAIATFIGFTSSTYFHTLFLRQVGHTPLEFRQRSRSEEFGQNTLEKW